MQPVESYVRTQSPSVKEGCAALDPSSPPQLRIKLLAPHPTVSRDSKSVFSFSKSFIAPALQLKLIFIAADLPQNR